MERKVSDSKANVNPDKMFSNVLVMGVLTSYSAQDF